MRILVAQALGMCFGVRDALAATERVLRPAEVTIHGQLVHNPEVTRRLAERGFGGLDEAGRGMAPATPAVLVTAHGISERARRGLEAAGKTLIDTTCPLVRRAHHAAQLLAAEGRHVVVVGKRGHVEICGIVGDLASYTVVEAADEVSTYSHARLGVMCQTTTPSALAARVLGAVRAENPEADVRYIDTICQPTKDRQTALAVLLRQADAVLVIGGRNSNNTRELVLRCEASGVRAWHVEAAGELHAAWFARVRVLGVTAGTSTLPQTIDGVVARLRAFGGRVEAGDASTHGEAA